MKKLIFIIILLIFVSLLAETKKESFNDKYKRLRKELLIMQIKTDSLEVRNDHLMFKVDSLISVIKQLKRK